MSLGSSLEEALLRDGSQIAHRNRPTGVVALVLLIWVVGGIPIFAFELGAFTRAVLCAAVVGLGLVCGMLIVRSAASGRGVEEEIDRRERSYRAERAIAEAKAAGEFDRWEKREKKDGRNG